MYLMHSFSDSTSCSAPRLLNFQSHAAAFAVDVLCHHQWVCSTRNQLSPWYPITYPRCYTRSYTCYASCHDCTQSTIFMSNHGLVMADVLVTNDKILRSGGWVSKPKSFDDDARVCASSDLQEKERERRNQKQGSNGTAQRKKQACPPRPLSTRRRKNQPIHPSTKQSHHPPPRT